MSRKPRNAGEYLHIIARGIGKQILFEDQSDNERYLSNLKKFSESEGITILAYCLMENHVHLLIRDAQGSVSSFMKKMGISYALYYNKKYDRTGHLFQDRYKSENIINDAHLLSAFRYILNNPVKAGLCGAAEYRWSSYNEYGKKDGLTDTGMLFNMIGDKESFAQFMMEKDGTEHIEADIPKKDDTWALQTIRETLNINSGTQIQQFERTQRDEALALLKSRGLTVRQLERLTGINRGAIQKAKSVI